MNIINGHTAEECEKAVLGAAIAEYQTLSVARAIVSKDFFLGKANAEMFGILCELDDERKSIDCGVVFDEVDKKQGIVSRELVLDCINSLQHVGHMATYARMVAQYYYERKIISACRELAQSTDTSKLIEVEKWVKLKETLGVPTLFSYTRISDMLDLLESIQKKKESEIYQTGYAGIDSVWHGMRGGEVNTWAASTNTGKSLLLLNLLWRAAESGKRCLWVGTEMSNAETAQRHLSMMTAISPWKIRTGELDIEELSRIKNAISDRLPLLQVSMYDDPEPTIEMIEAAINTYKPQIVFLDYLERFSMPKEETLRLRIREFMRQLKTMAMRKNVLIHLAAQLNRQTYGMEDRRRPSMAEISESSAVEKESDRVVLIWEPKDKSQDFTQKHTISTLELITAKNRHGSRGLSINVELDRRTLIVAEKEKTLINAI